MNKNQAGRLLVSFCAALMTITLLWGASRLILAGTTPKRITIICSNDTLGNLEPCG